MKAGIRLAAAIGAVIFVAACGAVPGTAQRPAMSASDIIAISDHRFDDALLAWHDSGQRLSEFMLYPVRCRPETDYGAPIYAATDMVIDCLRDPECSKTKIKDPDDIVHLRPGGKDECRIRNPEYTQASRTLDVIMGVLWRRLLAQEAIDEYRQAPFTGSQLAERETALTIHRNHVNTVIDGLNGYRDFERYLAVDNLGALKAHLKKKALTIEAIKKVKIDEKKKELECRLRGIESMLAMAAASPEFRALDRWMRDNGFGPLLAHSLTRDENADDPCPPIRPG